MALVRRNAFVPVTIRIVAAFVATVSCCAAIVLNAALAQNSTVMSDDRLEEGRALIERGDYRKAHTILSLAHRRGPSPELEIALARAKFGLGDYRGVLTLLARGAGDDKDRARNLMRSEALLRLRRFDEAASLAARAGAAGDPAFSFVEARADFGRGFTSRATARIDEVVRSGYALADAYAFRARISLEQNDTVLGRKYLQRAIEAGADTRAIEIANIEADIRDGEFDKAARRIAGLAAQDKDLSRIDPRVSFAEGFLAAAQGDYHSAARKLASVEYWLRTDEKSILPLAVARRKSGDGAQAETLLRRRLDAAPADWRAADQLAALLMDRRDDAAALATIDAFEGASEARLAGAARRFDYLLRQHRFDEAHGVVWKAAQSLGSDTAPVYSADLILGPSSALSLEAADKAAAFYENVTAIRRMSGSEAVGQPASEHTDPISLVIAGEQALDARRYDRAVEFFERALQGAPGFATAARLRRLVDVRGGVEQVTADNATTPLAETIGLRDVGDLAAAALRAGEHEAAISLLTEETVSFENDPRLPILLARAYRAAGDDEKLAGLARSLSLAPMAHRRQHIMAARIFESENDIDAAIDVFKQALSARPNDRALVQDFIALSARHDRPEDASRFFNVVVKRVPDAHEMRFHLAMSALVDGDAETFERQRRFFQKAQTPHLEWLEIEAVRAAGDTEKALASARRLAARTGRSADAAIGDAALLVALGDIEAAKQRLASADVNGSESIAQRRYLAEILIEAKDRDAVEPARFVYLSTGRSPNAAVLYALALWGADMKDAAVEIAREAAWSGAPSPGYSIKLAKAMNEAGNTDLSRLIAKQIVSAPLPASEREAALEILALNEPFSPSPPKTKRLRG